MAEHHEGFASDVGGKLLLISALLAIFGVIALVLMPLGAAFAPPPTPPAATASAPAAESAPAATDTAVTTSEAAAPADSAAPAAAQPEAPKGPPPFIAAFFPGIILLIVSAVLGVISALLLGYAKAREDEAAATPTATAPH
jgi:ABC-type glycerol-3-phosphate transport system permease component